EQATTFDPEKVIVKPNEINSSNQETTNTAPAGAEPGVGANTAGPIIAGGAGGGGTQSSSQTDEKTKNTILASSTQTTTQTPAGKEKVESATVRVPRSYFVNICKQRDPNGKDPDEAAVKAVAKEELASIREGVKRTVGLHTDD